MMDTEESNLKDRIYSRGSRAAWVSMLYTCMRELDVDDPLTVSARLVAERESAISALRRICEDHGDNDWPDTLYLADIVEKHLGRHLR